MASTLALCLLCIRAISAQEHRPGWELTSPEIPDPGSFLASPYGERFWTHLELRRYFERVCKDPRAQLHELGKTTRGNPLYVVLLSSKQRLEAIRRTQADLKALVAGKTKDGPLSETTRNAILNRNPAVAWLSYGVHGNEPSPTDTAAVCAYELLAKKKHQKLLDELIVVIDPCLNPDGRERYLASLRDRLGKWPDPNPISYEHAEPWPGGRVNQYLQDLNRDWAFQTQRETRLRIAFWLTLPPQVHVDFHEMSAEQDYFFFPAELPIHPQVSARVLRWHESFGTANAAAFDRRHWRYYSREDFDLYYPGYGDSWPSLMGAVGMTYEVGGHTAGSLRYERRDGTVWTLRDRIDRHLVTSLTSLETAARGRRQLLADFERQHREAEARGRSSASRYLVVESRRDPAAVRALAELLRSQGIEAQRSTAPGTLTLPRSKAATGLRTQKLSEGSLVVDLSQARGRLAAALLEPDPRASHLYFYDVSAWSLPMAFGLEHRWASKIQAALSEDWNERPPEGTKLPKNCSAVVIDAHESRIPSLLARRHDEGFEVRVATREFRSGGRSFARGSLVLLPGKDPTALEKALGKSRIPGFPVTSMRSESGPDLGSYSFERVLPPRALLAFGRGVSISSAGGIWHLFEERLGVPITRIDVERLGPRSLSRFNLLILPGGKFPESFESKTGKAFLLRWIEEGGVMIAMGAAASRVWSKILGGKEAKTESSGKRTGENAWRTRDELEESSRKRSSPGAILEIQLDPSSLICASYGKRIPVLVRGSRGGFPTSGPGHVVGLYGTSAEGQRVHRLSGYFPASAAKHLEGSGYLLEWPRGRGRVILFHQDPQFRLIWHGLTRIFLNAALLFERRRPAR